jgi:hypothetical protein
MFKWSSKSEALSNHHFTKEDIWFNANRPFIHAKSLNEDQMTWKMYPQFLDRYQIQSVAGTFSGALGTSKLNILCLLSNVIKREEKNPVFRDASL